MAKVTLAVNITGMHCEGCVARVRQGLSAVKGVSIEALAVGKVIVSYEDTEVSRSRILETIRESGGYGIAGFERS